MGESDGSDGPRDKKRYDNNVNSQKSSIVAQKIGYFRQRNCCLSCNGWI